MTVTLTRPWTYRTPLLTVDYPAGEHDMPADHAAAARADKATKEKRNGNRTGKAVPPSDPVFLEG
jgi:hypothetical protein